MVRNPQVEEPLVAAQPHGDVFASDLFGDAAVGESDALSRVVAEDRESTEQEEGSAFPVVLRRGPLERGDEVGPVRAEPCSGCEVGPHGVGMASREHDVVLEVAVPDVGRFGPIGEVLLGVCSGGLEQPEPG